MTYLLTFTSFEKAQLFRIFYYLPGFIGLVVISFLESVYMPPCYGSRSFNWYVKSFLIECMLGLRFCAKCVSLLIYLSCRIRSLNLA